MFRFIGYNYGRAGNVNETGHAASTIEQSPYLPSDWKRLDWTYVLSDREAQGKRQNCSQEVATYTQRLSQITQQPGRFVVLGGDHSAAMGTWAGARLAQQQPFALIWIDAHMDAHTFASTASGNIHGMPLAALLGHGQKDLMPWYQGPSPVIGPQHTHIIGYRSYETEEHQLLSQLGVSLYAIEQVQQCSFAQLVTTMVQTFKAAGIPYGISLDLDGIDPMDAPAVTVPETGGIEKHDLLKGLQAMQAIMPPIGLEIVEFAPNFDKDHKTERLIIDCIAATFGSA